MNPRDQWSQERLRCFVCGKGVAHWKGLHTHEIARGVHRQKALKEPVAWLRVCGRCHEQLDDYQIWPIARQLALKKVCDLQHYDRVQVNRLRGRQDGAVTEAEVDAFMDSIPRWGKPEWRKL